MINPFAGTDEANPSAAKPQPNLPQIFADKKTKPNHESTKDRKHEKEKGLKAAPKCHPNSSNTLRAFVLS
jgi:hypothetical protein